MIGSALALFVYLPSCMFVCLSVCIVLFGFSAEDMHGRIIVVEQAVSAQMSNAFILSLSPLSLYMLMSFYFSLCDTLNLFHNMAFTPEQTNSMKLGHGWGCFTASVFFGLSVF